MTLYGGQLMTFDLMMRGLLAANDRFDSAIKEPEAGPALIALFEALNWIVAMDERIGDTWQPDGKALKWKWRERISGAEAIGAVRFARNRVHHDWVDALSLRTEGLHATFPRRAHNWVWRPVAELPPEEQKDERGKEAYGCFLDGQLADVALKIAAEVFGEVRRFYEPEYWLAKP